MCVCVYIYMYIYLSIYHIISYSDIYMSYSDIHIVIYIYHYITMSVQFSPSSLCNPMDWSTPGFPVHHQLPSICKLISIESVKPSNHLIHWDPLLLPPWIIPSIRVNFPLSQFFTLGDQSIEVSVTVSIVSQSICHEVMGPDAMILVFWMLSFKPTFSLSSVLGHLLWHLGFTQII